MWWELRVQLRGTDGSPLSAWCVHWASSTLPPIGDSCGHHRAWGPQQHFLLQTIGMAQLAPYPSRLLTPAPCPAFPSCSVIQDALLPCALIHRPPPREAFPAHPVQDSPLHSPHGP